MSVGKAPAVMSDSNSRGSARKTAIVERSFNGIGSTPFVHTGPIEHRFRTQVKRLISLGEKNQEWMGNGDRETLKADELPFICLH